MKNCEQAALGIFLCEWPDNMEYLEILECFENNIENEDEEPLVTIWEPFENYDKAFVIEQIENTKTSLLERYGE